MSYILYRGVQVSKWKKIHEILKMRKKLTLKLIFFIQNSKLSPRRGRDGSSHRGFRNTTENFPSHARIQCKCRW